MTETGDKPKLIFSGFDDIYFDNSTIIDTIAAKVKQILDPSTITLDSIYPVGSVYMSMQLNNSWYYNPNTQRITSSSSDQPLCPIQYNTLSYPSSYDTTIFYTPGDKCRYKYDEDEDEAYYKCTEATTGTWDSDKWKKLTDINDYVTINCKWEQIAEGRTLVGVGVGIDTNAIPNTVTIGDSGGEYLHTLTTNEIPKHRHATNNVVVWDKGNWYANPGSIPDIVCSGGTSNPYSESNVNTTYVGEGQSHNNMQPWVATYIWKRIA